MGRSTPFSRKSSKKQFKRSINSLYSRVTVLKAVWSKYLIKRLKVVDQNPWKDVDLPKRDKKPVRTLSSERLIEFFSWLESRWEGWNLPRLFFQLKSLTGCRLEDLCSVRSQNLKDGNLIFTSGTTKGRKERIVPLPADIYKEVKELAGETYLWERYSTEIIPLLKKRNFACYSHVHPKFDPKTFYWWIQNQMKYFNDLSPEKEPVRTHDFRKRFVTLAHANGIDMDKVAKACGMTVETAEELFSHERTDGNR